jgi:hypothetical protein
MEKDVSELSFFKAKIKIVFFDIFSGTNQYITSFFHEVIYRILFHVTTDVKLLELINFTLSKIRFKRSTSRSCICSARDWE